MIYICLDTHRGDLQKKGKPSCQGGRAGSGLQSGVEQEGQDCGIINCVGQLTYISLIVFLENHNNEHSPLYEAIKQTDNCVNTNQTFVFGNDTI